MNTTLLCTILVIEDSLSEMELMSHYLREDGFVVLNAIGAKQGLEVAVDQKPNVIVTDVVMPGIDGPTLAQRIRQNSPDLKIIFISGYTEDKLKDYMAPNTYFLPKPFSLKQLAAKVKEVLEE